MKDHAHTSVPLTLGNGQSNISREISVSIFMALSLLIKVRNCWSFEKKGIISFYVNFSQRDNEAISCPTAQNALCSKFMGQKMWIRQHLQKPVN
jgi:hypothetical protein